MNIPRSARPFHHSGSGDAILLIHGFTSTPQSMLPVARYFSDKGYTVDVPLLPGHGTTTADLGATPWTAWLDTVSWSYAMLRDRCDSVTVVGQSLGGALAILLAARENVDNLALINPAVFVDSPFAGLLGALRRLPFSVKAVGGHVEHSSATELCYTHIPLSAAHQVSLAFANARDAVADVEANTLLVTSSTDAVVHERSASFIRQAISCKSFEESFLTSSNHVATLDVERDTLVRVIEAFVTGLPAENR